MKCRMYGIQSSGLRVSLGSLGSRTHVPMTSAKEAVGTSAVKAMPQQHGLE